MRIILSLAVLSALNLWAQGPASSPKPPAAAQTPATAPKPAHEMSIPVDAILPVTALPPDTVVATVDGEKVTAGQLQTLLKAYPPQAQQQAQQDRRKLVERYGLMLRLCREAKKEKLEQQSPYKEQIEYTMMQVLAQAQVNRKFDDFQVAPEEIKKVYESNKDKYVQAKVKAIYLPFSTAPVSQADSKGKQLLTEAEAKAKAQDLVKQLRGGADFVKMVKEYSGDPRSVEKDGDFGFIPKSNQNLPADIRNAIFTAKAGDITDPVRQPNGFYIFRIEESGPQPFDQVQGTIKDELKGTQFQAWLTSVQKSLDVKMEHELPAGLRVQQPSASPAQPAAK